MAFGTSSKMFVATIEAILEGRALDVDGDTFKIALYDDTTTPDAEVAIAATAYNAGVWISGNEVSDTTEWPATGQALDSVTSTISTNVWKFDAADEVSDGTSATLADVRGCLIYSDTDVADSGLAFLSFGGAQAVTDGTFTVQFAGAGICTITV